MGFYVQYIEKVVERLVFPRRIPSSIGCTSPAIGMSTDRRITLLHTLRSTTPSINCTRPHRGWCKPSGCQGGGHRTDGDERG